MHRRRFIIIIIIVVFFLSIIQSEEEKKKLWIIGEAVVILNILCAYDILNKQIVHTEKCVAFVGLIFSIKKNKLNEKMARSGLLYVQ